MQFIHLPIGGAFLATLALIGFVINRKTGFESIATLYLAAGVICVMLIIEISDSRGDSWTWPCSALATPAPVLIQVAALQDWLLRAKETR
jgi:hypothetical protein